MADDRVTFRGLPVESGDLCWVVLRLAWHGKTWFPLERTFARTRREAIEAFEEPFAKSNAYRKMSRRGEVVAVRAKIEPLTSENIEKEKQPATTP